MLTLRSDQSKALEDDLYRRSARRILQFLRRHLPPETAQIDDISLLDLIQESDQVAKTFGIRTEAGRGRWAYLMLLTDGKVVDDPAIKQMFSRPGASPDYDVKRLLEATATSLSRQAP